MYIKYTNRGGLKLYNSGYKYAPKFISEMPFFRFVTGTVQETTTVLPSVESNWYIVALLYLKQCHVTYLIYCTAIQKARVWSWALNITECLVVSLVPVCQSELVRHTGGWVGYRCKWMTHAKTPFICPIGLGTMSTGLWTSDLYECSVRAPKKKNKGCPLQN
jgi:hypothetical protein